uniref:aminoacyl-tRNA deacylase n=1 Tax=Thaumasiovibrio occultus TaxID=1891184 RepID=UPI000B3623DD|nr:YbaK/EbsC family protein [Thaumasiovibrio occultus]
MKPNLAMQTPVMAVLEMAGIDYEILWHQRPATSIDDAAAQRGVCPSQMVKTMLLEDMGGLLSLVCLPGNRQVDPNKVRAHFQCRRMTCVKAERVFAVTGYHPGTVTPLALPRPLPVLVDPSLLAHTTVTISSGDAMAGLALKRDDLFSLFDATVVSVCRDES